MALPKEIFVTEDGTRNEVFLNALAAQLQIPDDLHEAGTVAFG